MCALCYGRSKSNSTNSLRVELQDKARIRNYLNPSVNPKSSVPIFVQELLLRLGLLAKLMSSAIQIILDPNSKGWFAFCSREASSHITHLQWASNRQLQLSKRHGSKERCPPARTGTTPPHRLPRRSTTHPSSSSSCNDESKYSQLPLQAACDLTNMVPWRIWSHARLPLIVLLRLKASLTLPSLDHQHPSPATSCPVLK